MRRAGRKHVGTNVRVARGAGRVSDHRKVRRSVGGSPLRSERDRERERGISQPAHALSPQKHGGDGARAGVSTARAAPFYRRRRERMAPYAGVPRANLPGGHPARAHTACYHQ